MLNATKITTTTAAATAGEPVRQLPAASLTVKPLVVTLMALAMAASVLLAVALPEPTPVAAQNTVEISIANGGGTTMSAPQLGIEYKLTPQNCTGVTGVAAKTEAAGASDDSPVATVQLDHRCDWQVEFCNAAVTLGPAARDTDHEGGTVTTYGNDLDGSFTLTSSNGKLVWQEAPMAADRTKAVALLTFYDPITFSSPHPCKQTVNVLSGGHFNYVPPAGWGYTFTPENCDSGVAPAVQTMSDAASSSGGSASPDPHSWTGHKLDTRCDWQVELCRSTAVGLSRDDGGGSDTAVTTPGQTISGKFKLTKSNGQLIWESGTQTTKLVNNITYDGNSPCLVTALHADSDSGVAGDSITNDTTPEITVSNVTGGAEVTVVATKGADTVSKTVTVGSSDTSVEVEFAGSTCDSSPGTAATEACGTLDDGEWVVTGTHTPSGSGSSDSLIGFTFTVDNTAPVIASITASPPLLTTSETSAVEFVFTDESDIIEFVASDVGIMAATPANSSAAALASLSGSGQTFTATFSATTNDTYTLTVTDGMVKDAAGNVSTAPASAVAETIKVDTTTTTTLTLSRQTPRSNEQIGLGFSMLPQNCAPALVSALGVKTEADATTLSDGTGNATIVLDVRCDWQIKFCGAMDTIIPENDTPGEVFAVISGTAVTLLGNSAMGRLEHAGTPTQSNANPVYGVARLALGVPSEPATRNAANTTAWAPCARVAVVPESGMVSARDASIEYTLTPSGCYTAIARVDPPPGGAVYEARELDSIRTSTFAAGVHVPAQTQADGVLDVATGALFHLLAADCNWDVSFCQAEVKLYNTAINPDVLRHTAARGAFVLSRSTATESNILPGAPNRITRIKGELLYLNDTAKPVDELRFSSAMECPPIALHDGSDSGLKGDYITNDTTPTFAVSDVTGGAEVTVTAAQGTAPNQGSAPSQGAQTTVSKTVTVGSSDTSVDVEFSGSTCGASGTEACGTLAEGDWVVTGTQTPAGSSTPEELAGFTLTVDTTAPTVTVTSAEADLTLLANPSAEIMLETSESTDDLTLADVTHNNAVAELSGFAATDAATYTATLTATAAGTAILSVPAGAFHDAAGNPNEAPDTTADPPTGSLNLTVNPRPKPSLALKDATSDTGVSATDGHTSNLTPTFTVDYLTAGAQVELTATSGVGQNQVMLTPPVATVAANETSVEFDFSASVCGAGNSESCALSEGVWQVRARHTEPDSTETFSNEFTVVVDTTAPVITSITATPASVGIDVAAAVEFVFDEVNGIARFEGGDVAIAAATPANSAAGSVTEPASLAQTLSSKTWVAQFSAATADAYTLSVRDAMVQDLAGNPNTAPPSVVADIVTVEVRPSQTPAVVLAAASDTGAKDGRYTAATEPTFRVVFPDDSTYVVTNSQVKVTATNEATNPATVVSKVVTATSGSSVDVVFAGATGCDIGADATGGDDPCALAPGDWQVKATHADIAGFKTAVDSAEIDVTVITSAAPVSLAASPGILEVASSLAVGATATLTFTAPASYAGAGDTLDVSAMVTMTGDSGVGSLGAWSGSGNTYTATFASRGIGQASFTVAANVLQDLAGNQNPALATPATIEVRVGPQPLELRNLGAARYAASSQYDVRVTPRTSSSACAGVAARNTEFTLAAGASFEIALSQPAGQGQSQPGQGQTQPPQPGQGQTQPQQPGQGQTQPPAQPPTCTWTFDFEPGLGGCLMSLWQFKESGHADHDASQGWGNTSKVSPTEPLQASSAGVSFSHANGTATIARAVFEVICPTEFTGLVELELSDPQSADHTGLEVEVMITKAPDRPIGCSVNQVATVELGASSPSGTSHTAMTPSLIDKLLDINDDGDLIPRLVLDTHRCSYIATFPGEIDVPGAAPYRLVRTSSATGTLKNTDVDSRQAAANYRVVRTGLVDLTNATTAGHSSDPTRRDVLVRATAGEGSGPGCAQASLPGSSWAVAAGAGEPGAAPATEADLGAADCAWNLTFTNTANDCRVFAQFKDANGDTIDSQVNNSSGALTVYVADRRVRSASAADGGGSVVASIEFSVPDPADTTASPVGVCNTALSGALVAVEVDDRDSGTHTGTEFAVAVADGERSDAGSLGGSSGGSSGGASSTAGMASCSQNNANLTLRLGANTGGTNSGGANSGGANTGTQSAASLTATGLIGALHDGATCSYEITFPPSVTSVGSDPTGADEDDVALLRQGSATATLRASTQVSRTYEAVRPALLELVNQTGIAQAAHQVAGMADVVVELTAPDPANPGSGCAAEAAGSPFTVKAGASEATPVAGSTMTAALGIAHCPWQLTYHNPNSDCHATVVLLDDASPPRAISSSDYSYPAAGPSGELTLYVNNNRLRTANSASGTAVTAAEFTVSDTCATFFPRATSVSVANAAGVTGNHSGTTVNVTVSQRGGVARAACSAYGANIIKPITLDQAGVGQVTFMDLVHQPLGQTACLYEASFETRVASRDPNNLLLNRTSTDPVDFDGSTAPAATAVAATYRAVSSAAIKLRNATPGNSAHPLAAMRDVVVTVAPVSGANCTASAPSGSPYALGPASEQNMLADPPNMPADPPNPAVSEHNVLLGTQQCVWTLTFHNRHADCLVTAQFRDASNNPVNPPEAPTSLAGGSVTINVAVDRATRIGSTVGSGNQVAAVEFAVPTTSCASVFDAEVSLSVTDTANPANPGIHAGTVFEVEVTKQTGALAGCSADQTANEALQLTLNSNGAVTEQFKLVDLPYGANAEDRCRYDVSFPASQNSAVSGATVSLENTGDEADVLHAGAPSRAREYDAVRPAKITLENASTAGHSSVSRGTINVTLTASRCSGAAAAPAAITSMLGAAGSSAAAVPVELGTRDCTWTATFQNPQRDCAVAARLEDSRNQLIDSSRVTAADGNGSLSFHVLGRRARQTDEANGTVLSKAKFEVLATCVTVFPGTVSVEVRDQHTGDPQSGAPNTGDPQSGAPNTGARHTGTKFNVTVAPASATAAASGCSPSQNISVTLDQPLSGSAPVFNLVDTPLGQASCVYTVTWENDQVDSVVEPTVKLQRPSTYTVTIKSSPPESRTASLTYEAVRAATVLLRNVTLGLGATADPAGTDPGATPNPPGLSTATPNPPSINGAGDSAGDSADLRSTVRLTPASASTCPASEATQFDLTTAAATRSVTLGALPCTWVLSFANPTDDCLVEAQLKDTAAPVAGNIGEAVTNQPGSASVQPSSASITLHVDEQRRTMSAASGGTEVGSVEFTVTTACDATFDGTVSISVSDILAADVSNRNHAGTSFDVQVSSSSGTGCSSVQSRRVTLNAQNTAEAAFARLVDTLAGGDGLVCTYSVSFPSSVNSATNSRVRLVNSNAGSVTLGGSSNSTSAATLTYIAALISGSDPDPDPAPDPTPDPTVPPPATPMVSVSAAPAVTEGEPLQFPVSLPGPAAQDMEVSYTVSGLPSRVASGTTPISDSSPTSTPGVSSSSNASAISGTAIIEAGQSSATISVPTENDDLDSANLTVRVTLTAVTGGVSLDPQGRTATGIVRDNDPLPTVGIKSATASGNELRFTLELNTRSARDVEVSYTTSLGGSGTAVIDAGQLADTAVNLFDRTQLPSNGALQLQLASAQHATIDSNAREQVLFPSEGAWQFHVTSRAGVTLAQLAETLGWPAGRRVFVWNPVVQRWDEPSNASAALPAGTTLTFRGAPPDEAQLTQAGLSRTNDLTLRQGWNIFTPAQAAVGLAASDFQQVSSAGTATGAGSAVVFDTRLIDCNNLAGVLVIYTYDQADPQAQNGFRLALPCHPQLLATTGIAPIETIDDRDVIYAWFNNTTPVLLTFAEGRYIPAT